MSGQWRFGLEEWDESGHRIVEKPVSFRGDGYYGNPHIYDAEGFRIVGCDEYDVFGDFTAPEGQRESVIRLLLAAPELLEALVELSDWVNRAIVPNYTDRKPMPANCAKALAASAAAIRKATGAAE